MLVFSNIPAEIEEEIEYTVKVPRNVTQTVSNIEPVPYIIEEEIEVPYYEMIESPRAVKHQERLFQVEDNTISNDHYSMLRFYLEKDDRVYFAFDTSPPVDAYILSSQQYSTFEYWGETSNYMDYIQTSTYTLTHTCDYSDDYYFVLADLFYVSPTTVNSITIDRFYTEEFIEYQNVTKYRTETRNYIEYRNETITNEITKTIYENETKTETITRKTSLLYKLLNIK